MFPHIDIEPVTLETCWWTDPSIDHDASDLAHWCETASMERIVHKAGTEPISKIRIHGLNEREVAQLEKFKKDEDSNDDYGANAGRFYEALRFGLDRIDFVTMRRRSFHGVPGIEDRTLNEINRYKAEIPMGLAWRHMLNLPNGESQEIASTEPIWTSLGIWLGTHILALTFRGGRRDA